MQHADVSIRTIFIYDKWHGENFLQRAKNERPILDIEDVLPLFLQRVLRCKKVTRRKPRYLPLKANRLFQQKTLAIVISQGEKSQ